MTTQRVVDMTLNELKALIAREIEERLGTGPRAYDPRTPQEILDSIDRNMWTPPPGTPSTLAMIREDRDR